MDKKSNQGDNILFIFILTVNTKFLDQRQTDLFTYAPSPPQGDMIKAVITCT